MMKERLGDKLFGWELFLWMDINHLRMEMNESPKLRNNQINVESIRGNKFLWI